MFLANLNSYNHITTHFDTSYQTFRTLNIQLPTSKLTQLPPSTNALNTIHPLPQQHHPTSSPPTFRMSARHPRNEAWLNAQANPGSRAGSQAQSRTGPSSSRYGFLTPNTTSYRSGPPSSHNPPLNNRYDPGSSRSQAGGGAQRQSNWCEGYAPSNGGSNARAPFDHGPLGPASGSSSRREGFGGRSRAGQSSYGGGSTVRGSQGGSRTVRGSQGGQTSRRDGESRLPYGERQTQRSQYTQSSRGEQQGMSRQYRPSQTGQSMYGGGRQQGRSDLWARQQQRGSMTGYISGPMGTCAITNGEQ